jgi:hypothetical protein
VCVLLDEMFQERVFYNWLVIVGSLEQCSQTIGWDRTCIANFCEYQLQLFVGQFLACTNVVQNLLHTRHDDQIIGILGGVNYLLSKASWGTLRITAGRSGLDDKTFGLVGYVFPISGTYLAILYSCITC